MKGVQDISKREEASSRIAELEAKLAASEAEVLRISTERDEARAELERHGKDHVESSLYFKALFNNSHTVMLITDPTTGSIMNANPAAELFYGYSVAQMRTMNISAINTLSPVEIAREMSLAKRKKQRRFIFKHRLANGEVRDVEVFSGPVKIHQRELLYSLIHDITEKKEAEEQMLICKRTLMSTPDLVSLVDKDYYYRMVNDAYLHTFQKKREEIVDRAVPELIGKDFFEKRSKPYLDKAFAGETHHAENTITLPHLGTIHLATIYHPVKDGNGDIKYVSVNARNVTQMKNHAEELERYSDRLALATTAGRIGIWEWEIDANNLIWDDMMMELYKVEPAQFSATYDTWRNKVHPDDLADAEDELREAMEENRLIDNEFRIVWPNGEVRHIKSAGQIKFDQGQPKRIIGVNWDVTKRHRMEQALRDLASTDALTGANNRRHFMERINEEAERSNRHDTPLSILTLDIDLFKNVNDTYGHPVGDIVLKELVATCKKTLRVSDILSRMGGEEFSAILPETDIEAAVQTAERVRKAVEAFEVMAGTDTIRYTISLGVSQYGGTEDSIDSLMRRADRALYQAKEAGRNLVRSL